MDVIKKVLDIQIIIETDKGEERMLCLTDFCESQIVDINYVNNDFTLTVKNANVRYFVKEEESIF